MTDAALLKLLDWMAADLDRRPSPATLATLARLGVRDLLQAGELVGRDGKAARQAAELLRALDGRSYPGDADAVVPLLSVVGARVLADEPENAADWAAAVRPLLNFLAGRPRNAGWQFEQIAGATSYWSDASGAQVVAGFLAAGRGPTYARDLIARALDANVPPDVFGYGSQIRPEVFTALTEAGITRGRHLAAYQEAGLTVEQAIAVATDGVCPGAAVALHHDWISPERWAVLGGGLPPQWFPLTGISFDRKALDPVTDGLRGRGFLWTDLRFLHEHGWDDLTPRAVDQGIGLPGGKGTGPIGPRLAVAAAAVIPLSKVAPWCTHLTDGKRGRLETYDPATPPLVGPPWHSLLSDALPAIRELTSLCVAPSSLAAFRKAGCRSVEDVATAVRAGVTAARAQELVDTFGTSSVPSAPRRIGDLRALLEAHRRASAGASLAGRTSR